MGEAVLVNLAGHKVGVQGRRLPGSALDAVDLALAYGLPSTGGEIVVAAVTVRPGRRVDGDDFAHAVRDLDDRSRPAVVRVVEEIPLSTWHRPLTGPLVAEGVPADGMAWAWRPKKETYVPVDAAARKRLGL